MRPRPDEAESEASPEAEAESDGASDLPRTGYRVAGNLETRSSSLEQEVGQLRDQVRAMEREMYAARKVVRRRQTLKAFASGGIGTAIALALAMVAYGTGVIGSPSVIFTILIVGFVLGALAGMRWDPPDDDFPAAPPPRIR
jgi:hypothetical protein